MELEKKVKNEERKRGKRKKIWQRRGKEVGVRGGVPRESYIETE